ncbi:cathepsin L [Trichonephila clavipes]|nr:cathepsin L [Trichonephila clavipes]
MEFSKGRQFWCYFKKEKVGATLKGYVDIPEGNEKELFKAVATVGPESVGINARGYGFMHYDWSPYWGEDGYIRMARNKNNMCGIASMASYPLV